MKLHELVKLSQADYDAYDTDFDTSVTVCYIGKINDDYDRFCDEIIKKVEVIRIFPDSHIVVDWSKLIRDNMEMFRAFTEEYWDEKYREDEDEFMYKWIEEIHLFMAGYAPEDFYGTLFKFAEALKA